MSISLIHHGFRTVDSVLSICLTNIGHPFGGTHNQQLLNQYVQIGGSVLCSPSRTLHDTIKQVHLLLPELCQACWCSVSNNGNFLLVCLRYTAKLVIIDLLLMAADIDHAYNSESRIHSLWNSSLSKRSWSWEISAPSQTDTNTSYSGYISDCGQIVCMVNTLNSVFLHTLATQWRQVPCPMAVNCLRIHTIVVFSGSQLNLVFLGLYKNRRDSYMPSEKHHNNADLTLALLNINVDLQCIAANNCWFHEFPISQPTSSGIVHPSQSTCDNNFPSILESSLCIDSKPSWNSELGSLAVHIHTSHATNHTNLPLENNPRLDMIFIIHNISSPRSYGVTVGTSFLFQQNPALSVSPMNCADNTDICALRMSGNGDKIASLAWITSPFPNLLVVLTFSGKVTWITPSGRASCSYTILPELQASWQLRHQDLLHVSKLTMRKLNQHEKIVSSLPIFNNRLFNSGDQIKTVHPKNGPLLYSLRSCVVSVPDLDKPSGTQFICILLASDGRILVSHKVPFSYPIIGAEFSNHQFKSTHPPSGNPFHQNEINDAWNLVRCIQDSFWLNVNPTAIIPASEKEWGVSRQNFGLQDQESTLPPIQVGIECFKDIIDTVLNKMINATITGPNNSSSSNPCKQSYRGFVCRDVISIPNSNFSIPNLGQLCDLTCTIVPMTIPLNYCLTLSDVISRLISLLVDQHYFECAMQIVILMDNILSSLRYATKWVVGWMLLKDLLINFRPYGHVSQQLLDSVEIQSSEIVGNELGRYLTGFKFIASDEIKEAFMYDEADIIYDETCGQSVCLIINYWRLRLSFQDCADKILLKLNLAMSLALGREKWDLAFQIFNASMNLDSLNTSDFDPEQEVQKKWISFASQVISAFPNGYQSTPVIPVVISSAIDENRMIFVDLVMLQKFMRYNQQLFDPRIVLESAARTCSFRVLKSIITQIQSSDLGIGQWTDSWPNIVLLCLALLNLAQNEPEFRNIWPLVSSIIRKLMMWLLHKNKIQDLQYIVQLTTLELTKTRYIHPNLKPIDKIFQDCFGLVLQHLNSEVYWKLPLRMSLPPQMNDLRMMSKSNGIHSSDRITQFPGIEHLLQQSVFEVELNNWPSEVNLVIVELLVWIKCAVHLSGSIGNTPSIENLESPNTKYSHLNLFTVLRICYALDLRGNILQVLQQHNGNESAACTSVSWVENCLMLLHFDDLFGELAVVKFVGRVLRKAKIIRSSQAIYAQDIIYTTISSIKSLVTERVVSLLLFNSTPWTKTSNQIDLDLNQFPAPCQFSCHTFRRHCDSITNLMDKNHSFYVLENGDSSKNEMNKRVRALIGDVRFRSFCEKILPIINEHILQHSKTENRESPLFDLATCLWEPSFPPLIARDAILWVSDLDTCQKQTQESGDREFKMIETYKTKATEFSNQENGSDLCSPTTGLEIHRTDLNSTEEESDDSGSKLMSVNQLMIAIDGCHQDNSRPMPKHLGNSSKSVPQHYSISSSEHTATTASNQTIDSNRNAPGMIEKPSVVDLAKDSDIPNINSSTSSMSILVADIQKLVLSVVQSKVSSNYGVTEFNPKVTKGIELHPRKQFKKSLPHNNQNQLNASSQKQNTRDGEMKNIRTLQKSPSYELFAYERARQTHRTQIIRKRRDSAFADNLVASQPELLREKVRIVNRARGNKLKSAYVMH